MMLPPISVTLSSSVIFKTPFRVANASPVSCAAPSVPQPLLDQLVEAGRLVVPVGDAESQQVIRLTRRGNESLREGLYHCRFVPLVGRHGWPQILEKVAGE